MSAFHFFDISLLPSSSKVASALASCSVVISRYTIVVWILEWPSRKDICTIFIPSSSQCDALACRIWGVLHIRHSKAMLMIKAGVNLVCIRDFLGHRSLTSTEIYAKIDNEQKLEAINKTSLTPLTHEDPAWLTDRELLHWLESLGSKT